MKTNKAHVLFELFFSFLKVGLFTFGGGYAMIPIIEREAGEKRGWINQNELLDILAISESTPGPISVNSATFIGYKKAGILGAIIATLGLIIPSFVIILIISIFYDTLKDIHVINAIFKGVRVGVIAVLIYAIIKIASSIKFNKPAVIIFAITIIAYLLVSFFLIDIPALSIIFIVLGAVTGIVLTNIASKGEKK